MKYSLGLNLRSHDVAFYLVDENRDLVFGVEEERFSFTKCKVQQTYRGLEFMLDRAGIDRADIITVGLAGSRAGYDELVTIHEQLYGPDIAAKHERFADELFELQRAIIGTMGLANASVVEVPHHLAHAVSGFAVSPTSSAVVVAIDGAGDQYTTVVFHMDGTEHRELMTIPRPHSLGWIWEATTRWAGLGGLGQEGKLMGLAAYGEPIYARAFYEGFELLPTAPIFEVDWSTGQFRSPVGMQLFAKALSMADVYGELEPSAGIPCQLARDVAASLQQVTNEIMLAICNAAREATGETNLVLTGGVAMNSVTNGELMRTAGYESVFVPPNASDNGLGLGAALCALQPHLPQAALELREHHLPYVGPEFDDAEIEAALAAADLTSNKPADLYGEIASQLVEGKVVGWFQGRMEIGARALGNRSIIANPCRADMKDVVNGSVKFREPWRPFAPLVKRDKYGDWFDDAHDDVPYMTSTHVVTEAQRDRIPSVVHADGTGRVQTCTPEDNDRMYRLLDAFEARTGVPVLMNTSFNIKGMPIVCRPTDAIECFLATGMQTLVLGDHVVTRGARMRTRAQVSAPVRFFGDVVQRGDEVVLITSDEWRVEHSERVEQLERLGEDMQLRLQIVDHDLDGWAALGDAKVFALIDYADNFPNGYEQIEGPLVALNEARLAGGVPGDRLFMLNYSGASWIMGQIFGEAQWQRLPAP